MWRSDRSLAFVLSVVTSIVTLVPYLLALRIVGSDQDFSGFLLNPVDGFSYLAKMRQGELGSWGFQLPYASEPGPATFLYLYYIFLGHVARWMRADLIVVFHSARLLGALAMYYLAYLFLERTRIPRRARFTAFMFVLVGSGFGWLGILFGLNASDLLIPESIPFLAAYVNAHFPLATALLIASILLITWDTTLALLRAALVFLTGTGLAIVLPFAVLSLAAILGTWLLIERLLRVEDEDARDRKLRIRLQSLAILLTGSAPWIAYGFWLTRTHPVISVWMRQNQTPSPPPIEFAIGFGILVLLGILGLALGRPHLTGIGRLLLVWVSVNSVLLYVPFSLQRRFSIGLYLPLAALAGLGLHRLVGARRSWALALLTAIALAIPSNILVVGAGLAQLDLDGPLVIRRSESEAYKWISDQLAADSLILASPTTGNRLPAFSDVRVLYGHPFETPFAESTLQRVEGYFQGSATVEAAYDSLRKDGVRYVFFGPRERRLGDPPWRESMPIVFANSDIQIHRVVEP